MIRSSRNAAKKVSVRQRPCGTLATKPGAADAAAVAAGHVGLGPSLVEEHQAFGIEPALVLAPSGAPPGDVSAILLAGVQAFF